MQLKILCLGLLLPAFAFGQTASLISSKKAIKNLKISLTNLSHQTNLPVIFPEKIPVSKKHTSYYIHTETNEKNQYKINVDTTLRCHGAHYCNIGSLMAIRNGSPQIYESMDHQKLTVPVPFTEGKKAWFTPSHAMGSYWPAQLEWREKSILYRLSWNVERPDSESSSLLSMARSAKH